ncbi:hypothetical protein Pst134EB_027542 [Puccinia striiformis f. sp. tritici]|nr:hypothetical protein Pst134EB_027542 [Puccinia striiformis f. sp. tritici]
MELSSLRLVVLLALFCSLTARVRSMNRLLETVGHFLKGGTPKRQIERTLSTTESNTVCAKGATVGHEAGVVPVQKTLDQDRSLIEMQMKLEEQFPTIPLLRRGISGPQVAFPGLSATPLQKKAQLNKIWREFESIRNEHQIVVKLIKREKNTHLSPGFSNIFNLMKSPIERWLIESSAQQRFSKIKRLGKNRLWEKLPYEDQNGGLVSGISSWEITPGKRLDQGQSEATYLAETHASMRSILNYFTPKEMENIQKGLVEQLDSLLLFGGKQYGMIEGYLHCGRIFFQTIDFLHQIGLITDQGVASLLKNKDVILLASYNTIRHFNYGKSASPGSHLINSSTILKSWYASNLVNLIERCLEPEHGRFFAYHSMEFATLKYFQNFVYHKDRGVQMAVWMEDLFADYKLYYTLENSITQVSQDTSKRVKEIISKIVKKFENPGEWDRTQEETITLYQIYKNNLDLRTTFQILQFIDENYGRTELERFVTNKRSFKKKFDLMYSSTHYISELENLGEFMKRESEHQPRISLNKNKINQLEKAHQLTSISNYVEKIQSKHDSMMNVLNDEMKLYWQFEYFQPKIWDLKSRLQTAQNLLGNRYS